MPADEAAVHAFSADLGDNANCTYLPFMSEAISATRDVCGSPAGSPGDPHAVRPQRRFTVSVLITVPHWVILDRVNHASCAFSRV